MAATGNAPPAALPARARYLQNDMHRDSQFFGVPMQTPAKFPSNTLTGACMGWGGVLGALVLTLCRALPAWLRVAGAAMRVLTAIQQDTPEAVAPVSRALWRAFWQNKEVGGCWHVGGHARARGGARGGARVARTRTSHARADTSANVTHSHVPPVPTHQYDGRRTLRTQL